MAAKKTTGAKKTQNKKSAQSSRVNKQQEKENIKKEKVTLNPRIKAIIYFGIALVFLCLILIKGENVWSIIRGFFFGVFGSAIILLPIIFGYLAVITEKEGVTSKLKLKSIICALIALVLSTMQYIFSDLHYGAKNFFGMLGDLYKGSFENSGVFTSGGGLISGILGYPMVEFMGATAAGAVDIIALIVLVMIIARLSVSSFTRAAKKPIDKISQSVKHAKDEYIRQREQSQEEYIESTYSDTYTPEMPKKASKKHKKKYDSYIDIPVDEPRVTPEKEHGDLSKVDISSDDDGKATDATAQQDLLNTVRLANGEYDSELKDNKASAMAKEISKDKQTENPQAEKPSEEKKSDYTIEFASSKKSKKSQEIKEHTESFANEVLETQSSQEGQDKSEYQYPPVALLHPSYDTDDEHAMAELHSNADKLIETLKSFGVTAYITNICRGPSVTRYELQPGAGVKISKITNLADDIALNLAAERVRIEAPIPGKAAIGIEVPNKVVSMVSMRELIDSEEFKSGKSKLTCVLGKDISGNNIVTDLGKMPHLLIAGTTGSGKSVCVNSILISFLYKATPDEVKMLLIDPKMVEFSKYKGIPHLLVPVVSDAKKAAGALSWAVTEMLQRYKIFSEYDCKNVQAFNTLVETNLKFIAENSTEDEENCMEVNGLPVPKEKMPQIVIAIDELADLMMAAPNEVEESICRLAQMARAAGMHLIIATQRPSVNVITGVIKANIPSRISLKVSSNIDSRTILDVGGAEKLIGHGDMLFAPVGASNPLRVQGCYASDEEIERVTGFIKKSHNASYNVEIEEKIRKIAAEEISIGGKSEAPTIDGNEVDSKMEEAIKCVIEAGQASTSLLQRRIKVGYARAGRMIDDMEQMGIVGPHQGSKPREVLMTYQQWLERNNVLGDSLNTDSEE